MFLESLTTLVMIINMPLPPRLALLENYIDIWIHPRLLCGSKKTVLKIKVNINIMAVTSFYFLKNSYCISLTIAYADT